MIFTVRYFVLFSHSFALKGIIFPNSGHVSHHNVYICLRSGILFVAIARFNFFVLKIRSSPFVPSFDSVVWSTDTADFIKCTDNIEKNRAAEIS